MQETNERSIPAHDPLYVPSLAPWATRLSRSLRFKFFLTGVVFPLICLGAIVFGSVPSSEIPWQSGRLYDHVVVFLSYPAISAFFPLLILNFVAMAIWCFRPGTFRYSLIRVGIYSGAINALMFNVLLTYTVAFLPFVFALIAAPVLALIVWVSSLLLEKFFRKRFSILYLFVVTTVCCVALAITIPWLKTNPRFMNYVATPVLLILGCAAPLGLVTFARASRVVHYFESRRSGHVNWTQSFFGRTKLLIAGWISWAVGMVASWKYALEMEAAEYLKLPTTDPNCYVSAAAAHGHRRFVGAVQREGNVRVNLQMKRLKFLEFSLATSLPQLHRIIRVIYNRVGPKLAKLCGTNVWFADLTYVWLKPLELSAELIRRVARVPRDVVLDLYEETESRQAV